jgi:hypothetical protein
VHLAVAWEGFVLLRKLLLDRNGGFNGLNNAIKSRKNAITSGIDYAALVGSDVLGEDLAVFGEGGNSGALVIGHESRIAGNIRSQYSRKLPCVPVFSVVAVFFWHAVEPPNLAVRVREVVKVTKLYDIPG